jgi:hypothetical protein
MTYGDLMGTSPPESPAQRDCVYWCSFREELGWFARANKVGRVGLFGWIHSLSLVRSFAWWNWKDPMPFVAANVELVGQVFRKFLGN